MSPEYDLNRVESGAWTAHEPGAKDADPVELAAMSMTADGAEETLSDLEGDDREYDLGEGD